MLLPVRFFSIYKAADLGCLQSAAQFSGKDRSLMAQLKNDNFGRVTNKKPLTRRCEGFNKPYFLFN